jgi:hydrogenase nickel incorporation protein HypA/HybF
LICLPEFNCPEFVKESIMHELRIAEDLSAIVLETARNENLSIVGKVNISFGQLVQIVPEIFEFAFREAVRNTIAEDAELSIEIIKVKIDCIQCGCNFDLNKNLFKCCRCGSTDLRIINGKELFVKSIEGE